MAKITRKSYQRKKIIMGITLFGAVGLVSTGFAAWVLSAGTSVPQQATLNAGTVDNTNMKFSAPVIYKTGDGTKASINTFSFQPKLEDNQGRIKSKAGDPDELLSLTVETTLTNAQNLGRLYVRTEILNQDGQYTKVDEEDPNSEVWTTNVALAASKGYIVLPESIDAEIDLYTRDADDAMNEAVTRPGMNEISIDTANNNLASISYEFKFEWGAFFGGMNPCLFFDSSTAESTKTHEVENVDVPMKGTDFSMEEIEDVLLELHDLLDTAQLTLTFFADPV